MSRNKSWCDGRFCEQQVLAIVDVVGGCGHEVKSEIDQVDGSTDDRLISGTCSFTKMYVMTRAGVICLLIYIYVRNESPHTPLIKFLLLFAKTHRHFLHWCSFYLPSLFICLNTLALTS